MKTVESAYRGRVLNFSIYGGSHEPCLGIHVQGLPMGEVIDPPVTRQMRRHGK